MIDGFSASTWLPPIISGVFMLFVAVLQRRVNAMDLKQQVFNEKLSETLLEISDQLTEIKRGTNDDRNNLSKLQYDIVNMMKETQVMNLKILEEMEKISTVQSNIFVMMKIQEGLKGRLDN